MALLRIEFFIGLQRAWINCLSQSLPQNAFSTAISLPPFYLFKTSKI